MNTEIPATDNASPAGWIFFDAACRFCVAQRRRCGDILERRGFVWLPLQTPGAAEQLGITDDQLRSAMWLQLADGRTLSGVDAWSALFLRVWWLWPVGVLLQLPGFHAAGRMLSSWIARHRHCLGGACALPPRD